jgi:hypothetical protein
MVDCFNESKLLILQGGVNTRKGNVLSPNPVRPDQVQGNDYQRFFG